MCQPPALDGGWVEAVLSAAAEQAKRSSVEVHTHTMAGNAAEAILDVADEVHADLVVVGNRRIGSKSRFILGNVPSRVVHHSTCSTYVVNTAAASAERQPARLNTATYCAERREHDERVEDLVVAERHRPRVRAMKRVDDRSTRVEQTAERDESDLCAGERIEICG